MKTENEIYDNQGRREEQADFSEKVVFYSALAISFFIASIAIYLILQ